MRMRKWVSPPSRQPPWPRWLSLSSMISRREGSSAASLLCISLAIIRLPPFHVLRNSLNCLSRSGQGTQMSNSDPFGFDISAAADKKRRAKGRRGMSGAFETSTRRCDKAGCTEPGQYRAPKSPRALDDYYWFCKEHVREYNLNWNYFQGQSEAEFQEFLDNATVWERPTKPFGRATQERKWARHG